MSKIQNIGCVIKDTTQSLFIELLNSDTFSNFTLFENSLVILDNIIQKYKNTKHNNPEMTFHQNMLKQCQENDLYLSPFQNYITLSYYNEIEDIIINPKIVNMDYYRKGLVYFNNAQFKNYFKQSDIHITIDIQNNTITIDKIPTTELVITNNNDDRSQIVSDINNLYQSSILIPNHINETQSFEDFKKLIFDNRVENHESLKKNILYFYNDKRYFQ